MVEKRDAGVGETVFYVQGVPRLHHLVNQLKREGAIKPPENKRPKARAAAAAKR